MANLGCVKPGISPTRYFQRLTQLLDEPEAVAVAPMVVRRLQRVRDRAAEQHRRRDLRSG